MQKNTWYNPSLDVKIFKKYLKMDNKKPFAFLPKKISDIVKKNKFTS